jgi:hypothetical protein
VSLDTTYSLYSKGEAIKKERESICCLFNRFAKEVMCIYSLSNGVNSGN